jgi:uncharacterized protein involved in exopolysaccharide biosynthesis
VCVGLATFAYVAFRLPNQYVAYSVLMIAPKLQGSDAAHTVVEASERFGETQLLLMMSGQVINKVKARLAEGVPAAAAVVQPRLEVAAGKGNTFIMKVRSTNFDQAQKFAVAWAQEFVEFKKQQRQTIIGASEASLQRDALLYEQKLERARTSLEDFKRKNNLASVLDAGVRAQQQLEQAKAARQQVLDTRQLIEGITGEELLTVSDDIVPGRNEERSGGATAATTAMMTRYIDLRLAVKRAESRLAELSADAPAAEVAQAKLEGVIAKRDLKSLLELAEEQRLVRLSALQVRAQSFEPLIQRLTDDVFNSVSLQNEYIRLQEDEKIYKDNLDVLRKQLANILSSNGDEEQFQQVEVGGGSPVPVGPNRPWLLTAGAIVGFILGLILAAAFGRPRPPSNGEAVPVGRPAPQP